MFNPESGSICIVHATNIRPTTINIQSIFPSFINTQFILSNYRFRYGIVMSPSMTYAAIISYKREIPKQTFQIPTTRTAFYTSLNHQYQENTLPKHTTMATTTAKVKKKYY